MKIVFKRGIGRKKARDMVLTFARYGLNHRLGQRHFATDAAAIRFIEQSGGSFEKLIGELQKNFLTPVPCEAISLFEGYLSAGDAAVSIVDNATGEVRVKAEGDGTHFTLSSYRSRFKQAVEQLHRATGGSIRPYEEILSAIQAGFASIEAFLSAELTFQNQAIKGEVSADEPSSHLSFDERLSFWTEKLTGRRLDKSGRDWQALQRLKAVRDDRATHPKDTVTSVSLVSIADLMNDFRGLAAILLQLHILFGRDAPSEVIRATFRPDAIVES